MCLPVKPFKVESEFEHSGLKCAVVMNREGGHRCGYVRVPPGHPYYGRHYDAFDVSVHGGLTFAQVEPCVEEDGTGWWFGFDCAHLGDEVYDPAARLEEMTTTEGREAIKTREVLKGVRAYGSYDHYWTQDEIEGETRFLAEQLAAVVV
jgi:hypothetical protein